MSEKKLIFFRGIFFRRRGELLKILDNLKNLAENQAEDNYFEIREKLGDFENT